MSAPGISAASVSRRASVVQPGRVVVRFVAGKVDALGAREFRGVGATDSLCPQDNVALAMSGADLRRIQHGPLAWDHTTPVGTIKRAWTTAHELMIDAAFPPAGTDTLADQLCAKVKAGLPMNLSLRFAVTSAEPIVPGRPERGIRATGWEALEVSLVLVGADPAAFVTARAARFSAWRSQMSTSLARARECAQLISDRCESALAAHARGDHSAVHRKLRAIASHVDALSVAHDQIGRELGSDPAGHDKFANPSASMGAQVSSGQAARARDYDYERRQAELRALKLSMV